MLCRIGTCRFFFIRFVCVDNVISCFAMKPFKSWIKYQNTRTPTSKLLCIHWVSCSGPLFYSCHVCLNTPLCYCLLHCHIELFFFAYIKGDYNNKVIIVYDKIEDNFIKICIMNKFQIKLQPWNRIHHFGIILSKRFKQIKKWSLKNVIAYLNKY